MSRPPASSVPSSGPTAPVPKDPQPSVDRIDDLARRILKGDILLPKFQRGLVWDKEQIIMLLDSVAKGFPIGSILLWQSRQELRSENRIADLNIDLPRPDYPVNYLLDGQQRLSAICGAMFWNEDDAKSRWNIVYDLRNQIFTHVETLENLPLNLIRVNKLSDPVTFFKHVASLETVAAGDRERFKQRAEALFNRFKDYKIATVTLGDMAIEDVAPVFERINSTGTRLTIVDLMRAATWSPQFDLVESIDEILFALREKGFDEIDRRVVLRNISAASGGGFTVESIDTLRHHTIDQLSRAVEETEEAYKRAVDFLVTEIGITHSSVIPYSNQIVVLAEIFRRLPVPNNQQLKAIVAWFWKTSVSGYFSGWSSGMMSNDLATVKNFAEGVEHQLSIQPRRETNDIWVSRVFRAGTAHSKLFAIILAHKQPVDLLTGQKIDVSTALAWNNVKEFHHFFPQAFLKKQNTPQRKINALANIIMLTSSSNKKITDKPPSKYLREIANTPGAQLETWLELNLISKEAYEAALVDDFDSFLKYRAMSIDQEIKLKLDE